MWPFIRTRNSKKDAVKALRERLMDEIKGTQERAKLIEQLTTETTISVIPTQQKDRDDD